MRRDIDVFLRQWQIDENRYPLLMRGPRQVGKSYSVQHLAESYFEHFVEVNFELRPEFKQCFEHSLEPSTIIESLSILSQQHISPGSTLLFLDEIQECPRAITALRYFYEKMPTLHVIGAGSLLDFALASEKVRMPVGRVQYVYMKPLSFGEFLTACNEQKSREVIANVDVTTGLAPAIHTHLLNRLKKYFFLGGMPAVIQEYIRSGNVTKCAAIQQMIAQTYRDDFGKYANRAKHRHLEKLYFSIPKMVGQKFKYSHVDPLSQSRELKSALELLEHAGVVQRVKLTSGAGLPLEANVKDRHFKMLCCDIGLMQSMCGLQNDTLFANDLTAVYAGALAEQFVGQELIAYLSPLNKPSLYYWAREAKNSSAEVDYLTTQQASVIPIEVKAGATGRLRSMQLFQAQYNVSLGVKISQAPIERSESVLSLPLYAIESLQRLLGQRGK